MFDDILPTLDRATILRIDTRAARIALAEEDLDTLCREVEQIRVAITDIDELDDLERRAYERNLHGAGINTMAAAEVRMARRAGTVHPDVIRSATVAMRYAIRAKRRI